MDTNEHEWNQGGSRGVQPGDPGRAGLTSGTSADFPRALDRNHGRYHGERIDLQSVLTEIQDLAEQGGWSKETFGRAGDFPMLALHRASHEVWRRIYLSAGMHGDEPAGLLAIRDLLSTAHWPERAEIWICPCLNPTGSALGTRENHAGADLNRDYRHLRTDEVRAHVSWLERQPRFDLSLCLHEDWEAKGFYLYELNPGGAPSPAERVIARVAQACPIDPSPMIDGRPATGGIIRPNLDPTSRPEWPEAFYLIQHKSPHSFTFEAPSDFPLPVRVRALVEGTVEMLRT
jgi:hypothetical protein